MTTQAKSSFQWGIILTLALSTIGFAAAYGAKAEKLETVVSIVSAQEQRLTKVENTVAGMASDIRVIRYILEGKETTH